MLPKPPTCSGCPLANTGEGFSHPSGPIGARFLFIGEALGEDESRQGMPFVGRAGQLFNKLLGYMGWDRGDVRVDNCIRCRPPRNWLVGAPWERKALDHCRRRLGPALIQV